jgi:signal transduction histidine kinase/HAMP domain-containing protein
MRIGAVENKARLAILVLILALLLLIALSLALFSRTGDQLRSPIIVYLFSSQIIALVFGILLVFLLARWLLRPYRRMVEAAQGSPVHPTAALTEGEFVAQTFQALVERLQANEKELAGLHALERRRAERSERFSERLIANIPSGLITVDSRGLVTSVNAHAMKIFGMGERPALAVRTRQFHTGELLSPLVNYNSFFSAAPQIASMIAECLVDAATFRREQVDVVMPDGRIRRVGLSVSPICDSAQHVEGALCLMTDITEVIELRERMKLKESLANLGEMAAGLAHEFKNSLATIHGYVQLLESQATGSASDADRRVTLEATLNEVRLLSKLVTDFLNFSRPQDLSFVEVDLREMLDYCIEDVRFLLKENSIKLTLEGEFPVLAADDSLLRRAFINLIRNAIEAIEPLSSNKMIVINGAIDSQPEPRYAHIRISDTGVGIAPEDLQRIFIPFFTTKSRGYGIGLALVQKILLAHGGDVTVESSDPTGTVFHCRLPLPSHH